MSELPPAFTYQEFMRHKVQTLKRTTVIGPPGCGKTRPIIEGVNLLRGFETAVLIVCSGPAVPAWIRQIPLWSECPEYAEFIYTTPKSKRERMLLWERAKETNHGVYITNFSIFYRDYDMIKQVPWRVVISDEYHKCMRNHKTKVKGRTKTYGMFKSMTLHTEILVLATGSIVRRNASSMFTAFQLVAPKVWRSYWKFVKMFCFVDDEGFGQRVWGVKNAQALRDAMDRHFAYVPEEVCAEALPEGRRLPIDVAITPEQARVYKELDEEMISVVGDTLIVTPTVMGKLVKLRQLLCCPRILDPSLGMGTGYMAIIDRLDMDRHVAIFVPFRSACDLIKEDLEKRGHRNVFILRGGITATEQAEIVEAFRQTRGIVIGTIQYAESFDLETCKTSYFLGYDVTADQNEQAEGRTRRAISDHKFVTWSYIKTNTPVDQHFLARLGEDERNAKLILQRPEGFIRKLMQRKSDAE